MKTFERYNNGKKDLGICCDVSNSEKIPKGFVCCDIINRDIKQKLSSLNVGESTEELNGISIKRIS